MKPVPAGWSRVSSAIFCREPLAELDWLARAFGFEVRIKVISPDGRLEHSEAVLGDGVVMVAAEGGSTRDPGATWPKSPRTAGGCTQAIMFFVDDADAHCARARAAGARIVTEPATSDYGPGYWVDRGYEAEDPEGHRWWFVQRLRENPA